MKKNELVIKATRGLYRASLKLRKHSPEILAVAGVVGVVASTVMACKATTKAAEILDEAKHTIDKIHEVTEKPENAEKYTENDKNKALALAYGQTAFEFVKLYGPSVALGAVSIGCMLTSNRILRKRNVALAAAYAAVDRGFKDYRGRVVERFGKDLDRELRHNIVLKEVETVEVDDKGKEHTVTKTVEVMDPNNYSEFARIYDVGNIGWEKDPEHNLYFLKCQQNYASERLKTRGYLFLNEVYEMLGFPPTKAGAQVGWIYDEEHPNGDNFVDFGIYNVYNPGCRDFVNGYERSIVLDFNVDGPILDLL